MASPVENMLWACGFILAAILLYRFGLPALRRFDAENVARIAREEQDKDDPNAHIRHALAVADEQVEPVREIKVGDWVQYLFETEVYADRESAEEARAIRVGMIARRFYAELPQAMAGRRTSLSARERAMRRWKRK